MFDIIKFYVDGGIHQDYIYIGITSMGEKYPVLYSSKVRKGNNSHTAEEESLYKCLTIIKELEIKEDITVYTDQTALINMVNCENVKKKILNKFPKMGEIKKLVAEMKVKLVWISGKKNPAHKVVTDGYTGTFHDNINELKKGTVAIKAKKTVPVNKTKSISEVVSFNEAILDDSSFIIEGLKRDLERKDIIIKDLMKIISKLNSCPVG